MPWTHNRAHIGLETTIEGFHSPHHHNDGGSDDDDGGSHHYDDRPAYDDHDEVQAAAHHHDNEGLLRAPTPSGGRSFTEPVLSAVMGQVELDRTDTATAHQQIAAAGTGDENV